MKHYRIRILVVLIILLCSNIIFAQNFDKNTSLNYKTTYIQVVRIDTMLDNYIIYAKTDTLQIRVLTWKCSVCCNNICIDDRLLVSLISEEDLNNIGMKVFSTLHIAIRRGRDKIMMEDEWSKLFFVKEIYGLCYTLDEETLEGYEQWQKEYFLPSLGEYYPPFRKKNKVKNK